jgi:hypothetical protein
MIHEEQIGPVICIHIVMVVMYIIVESKLHTRSYRHTVKDNCRTGRCIYALVVRLGTTEAWTEMCDPH